MENILRALIAYYSSLWVGVGVAVLLALAMIGVCCGVCSRKKPTLLTFVACLAVVPFTVFHVSHIYGALELQEVIETLSSHLDDVSDAATNFIDATGVTDDDSVNEVVSLLSGKADLKSLTRDLVADGGKMAEEAGEYLKWYIVRRVAWLLFIVAVCGGVMAATMRRRYTGGSGVYDSYDGNSVSSTNEWGI